MKTSGLGNARVVHYGWGSPVELAPRQCHSAEVARASPHNPQCASRIGASPSTLFCYVAEANLVSAAFQRCRSYFCEHVASFGLSFAQEPVRVKCKVKLYALAAVWSCSAVETMVALAMLRKSVDTECSTYLLSEQEGVYHWVGKPLGEWRRACNVRVLVTPK